MSYVTDVIFITMVDDPGIKKVNKKLTDYNRAKLVKVNQYCGGEKMMQADMHIAAFKNFDINWFLSDVSLIEFENQERVQILIKDEGEDLFTIYRLPERGTLEKISTFADDVTYY